MDDTPLMQALRRHAPYNTACQDALAVILEQREELRKIKRERSYHALHTYRESALDFLRLHGYELGMWDRWRQQPPPDDSTGALCAILDALTQEGVPAWLGDGVSCVHQIVMAQVEARRRVEGELDATRAAWRMCENRVAEARRILEDIMTSEMLCDCGPFIIEGHALEERARAFLGAALRGGEDGT